MNMLFVALMVLLLAQTDTLTTVYSEKWEGASESHGYFAEFMTSNDMIFVVLGVSLIIWFVLLLFLARTERRLKALEKSLHQS
jgi:heme/copper-type cytochrome/quinol oxidase subunit 2